MAKPRSVRFETPTARLRHTVRKKPYTVVKLARGIFLEYRRNKGAGTWIVRASDGHGAYWTKRNGDANEFETANGTTTFDYWGACERALVFARGTGDEAGAAPVLTVDQALTAYGKNLEALGGDEYNARRPRRYLPAKLLNRPVAVWANRVRPSLSLGAMNFLLVVLLPPASSGCASASAPRSISPPSGIRPGSRTAPDGELVSAASSIQAGPGGS